MAIFPEFAVHKIVPLKFAGVDLKLKTSHALFSSHHIDDGSMLLLKTLAQRQVVPETGTVLDAGCGIGTLALALKKFRPALQVTARDRLVLAARFTAENARLNGLEVDAAPGLLLAAEGAWNLIVSNLPAKAGEPVLKDFVARALDQLAPGGLVAVVIVAPLAPWLADEIVRAQAELVYRESTPQYSVFHFRASNAPAPVSGPPFPAAYRRGEAVWRAGPLKLIQKTFYGLPNFDALDYRTQLTLGLLEGWKPQGTCLVWEPVQGHLASWAAARMPDAALHVAGGDVLGLAAAAENCAPRPVTAHPAAFLSDLELEPVQTALIQLHPEPTIPWAEATADTLRRLVRGGGVVVVNGRATDVTRLFEHRAGLRLLRDERSKGWRAALLQRQTD